MLDGVDRLLQRRPVAVRRDRDLALERSTGPVSMPSSTKWTVTPVTSTPASSAWPIASRPGKAGSSAGWTLTMRLRKRSTNGCAQQLHVAGEGDRSAPRDSIQSPSAASRASRSANSLAGKDGGLDPGRPRPLQRPRLGLVGADPDHLDPLAPVQRVEDRLQVGARCPRRGRRCGRRSSPHLLATQSAGLWKHARGR